MSKGLPLSNQFRALLAELYQLDASALTARRTMPFTPLEEIEKALRRRVEQLVRCSLQESLDRFRGRV